MRISAWSSDVCSSDLMFTNSGHRSAPLEYLAEDLAADIGGAGLVVGHHAARGRHDRDAEAVVDLRQILDLLVDPTARLRHAIDLVDDRLAVLILQLDPQIAHALTNVLGRVAADVALPLQHIKDADPQIRRRALDDCLARTLSVADSRQQIAQGITQQHLPDTPLPARLDHARDLPLRGELPEGDAAQLEAPVARSRPAGEIAPVAAAGRRRVARQLGQLEASGKSLLGGRAAIVGERLQTLALRRIALGQPLAMLVLLDGTLLRHDLTFRAA